MLEAAGGGGYEWTDISSFPPSAFNFSLSVLENLKSLEGGDDEAWESKKGESRSTVQSSHVRYRTVMHGTVRFASVQNSCNTIKYN